MQACIVPYRCLRQTRFESTGVKVPAEGYQTASVRRFGGNALLKGWEQQMSVLFYALKCAHLTFATEVYLRI